MTKDMMRRLVFGPTRGKVHGSEVDELGWRRAEDWLIEVS